MHPVGNWSCPLRRCSQNVCTHVPSWDQTRLDYRGASRNRERERIKCVCVCVRERERERGICVLITTFTDCCSLPHNQNLVFFIHWVCLCVHLSPLCYRLNCSPLCIVLWLWVSIVLASTLAQLGPVRLDVHSAFVRVYSLLGLMELKMQAVGVCTCLLLTPGPQKPRWIWPVYV